MVIYLPHIHPHQWLQDQYPLRPHHITLEKQIYQNAPSFILKDAADLYIELLNQLGKSLKGNGQ